MPAKSKTNVYFLHGLLGTCYAHLSHQLSFLSAEFNVIPIDLPGHGKSPVDAVSPYFQTAVTQVSSTLALYGKGDLIAASYLGGFIAIRCALLCPELFRSLVLTGFTPNPSHDAICQWSRGFFLLAEKNADLALMLEQLHGARWRDTLEVICAELQDDYSQITIAGQDLALLQVPTILINGSKKTDERRAAAEVPLLSPLIESALIAGAGHIAASDEPDVFNLIMHRFWQRLVKIEEF